MRPAGVTPRPLDRLAASLFVPQLAQRIGSRYTLFEPEELDYFSWNLDACETAISEAEFSGELRVGTAAIIDLAGEALVSASAGEVRLRQLELIGEGDEWTEVELASWLDIELHRDDAFLGLHKAESQPWMHRIVDGLLRSRLLSLPVVARRRHELVRLLRGRIAEHGRSQVRRAAQQLIEEQPDAVETSPSVMFEMSEAKYTPYELFERHDFRRHAFGTVAHMNREEAECATKIDNHERVKRWLRNLDRQKQGGFSLPKSPGRFFPDFIVELVDGTIVLIEYKMGKFSFDPEERHKKAVGELWAARSAGRCRFGYVIDRNWGEVERVLQA
jgi:type III restriction enzyme